MRTATGVDQVLRRFRHAAGLTQEQLAQLSGLSVEAIRTLEIGRRRQPRATTLSRLAEAMELSPSKRAQLEIAARPVAGPHRLPADVIDFVGREDAVRQLTGLLAGRQGVASVVVSSLTGMGGVGKTTLAVHVGHRLATEYPDGRLYLNLRGATEPVTAGEALGTLLRTLGVPAKEVPEDPELAAARYRTVLAGRRVLLVLDDAATAEQVAPLVPGTPGSAALVTSRRLLDGLAGAHHVRLDVLSDAEGLRLLAEVVGPDRVQADEAAALDVVHRCGNLPLAIRIAGHRLAGGRPIRDLADRLADETSRLGELADGTNGVRASIALSLHDLLAGALPGDKSAARSLPTLSLLEGESFPLRLAAAVLQVPIEEAETILDRLVDVHLLDAPALHRYRMHDLVRAVGREKTDPQDRQACWERTLACYLAMVWRIDDLSPPGELSGAWKDPAWSAGARDLDDSEQILDWLDAERGALVRVARQAAAGSADDRAAVVRLAVGLNAYCPARKRWSEWRDVNRAAAEVVDAESDPMAAAMVRYDLGLAYGELDDFGPAADQLAIAGGFARKLGVVGFLADCLVNLGHLRERAGQPAEGFAAVREALELAERDPAASGCAPWANLTLGMLHGRIGEPDLQAVAFDRAVALAQDMGPSTRAMILLNIGNSFRECGRPAAAVLTLTTCLDLYRSAGREGGIAEALDELGRAHYDLRQYEPAAACYREGLGLAIQQQLWDREARIRTGLGHLHAATGHPGQARAEWDRAAAVLARHGMPAPPDLARNLT